MSVVPTRFLVELRDGGRPIGLYLHVHEDDAGNDDVVFSSEVTRALRFPTKARADDYIRSRVGFDAVAAPFPADELVRHVDQVSKGEVSDPAAR